MANYISKKYAYCMKRKRLEKIVLNLFLILRYSFCLELLVESIKAGDFFPCRNIFQLLPYILLNNLVFMPFKSKYNNEHSTGKLLVKLFYLVII